MVRAQATRSVVGALRAAGFTVARRRGSHSMWVHPSGVRVPVPDGHATISPGVYRAVLSAIEAARGRPPTTTEE